MSVRSRRRSTALSLVGTLVVAGLLAHAAQARPEPAPPKPAAGSGSSIATAADDLLVTTLRDRVPPALQGRIQPASAADDADPSWATLPDRLDGRVRLGTRGSSEPGRAGWRMLGVESARRIELARGAAYLSDEWDVLQSVDVDRLREYVVVREHQGRRTWRWQLLTAEPGQRPRITDSGRIDLGGGFHIEPPKLLSAELAELDRPVAWRLDGSVLELEFDDAGLELPYVIDPDATPPAAGFVAWSESSPYAHYNAANDLNRLWFNPNQSGTATATINAVDPESGVQYVTWPTPPAGWTPPSSNDSSASDASGLFATYWDNSQANVYPGNNFTGTSFTRIDPNIDFNWGNGTPYTELGADTFSIRWLGKLEAPETGTYYFQTRSDDGIRLWINGTEMASRWDDHGPTDYTGCAGGINLVAGTKYDVKMEFYENGGGAEARLRWRLPSEAATYREPSGCTTNVSPPRNHASGWVGGTSSINYPAVPASAFSTGGGTYTRTYTWSAGASGGSPTATARNNDGATTAPFPIEWVADNTPPVLSSGSVTLQTTGWGQNNNNRVNFPTAGNFSDAGSSATGVGNLTRDLQRRDGVSDGLGGCDTTAGSWTSVATNPGGNNINNGVVVIPAAGVCSEFRYVITDEVGNELVLQAPGFRGWDSANPSGAIVSITEGTNPQYQHVVGNDLVYFNGNQSGSFTVLAAPTDTQSGVASVRFYDLGGSWLPNGNSDVLSPGPFSQQFTWNNSSPDPDWENIVVSDFSTRNATISNAYRVRRDNVGPTGGTLSYWTPTWRNTTSVPVQMTAGMTDALSGVASYQLQREEVTWTAGSCPVFGGPFTDIGAAVTGTPPAPFTINDSSVQDGRCYRYRVLATDNVGNTTTTLAPTQSVRVDDTDPVATLNAMPATGSGTLTVGGTSSDTMSGVTRVEVRIEDQANPGVFTSIYTDTTTPSPTWGPYSWNTTALNGTFNIYVDVEDAAGNIVTAVTPSHVILLDNSPPTITFDGFTEGTNPGCQHVDAIDDTLAWVRSTGGCTGSIVARFTPADGQSAIDHIDVDGAPAGWTPGTSTQVNSPGPWQHTYSWTGAATAFGVRNANATNAGGLVSTNASFTIQLDNTAPTGGSITYPTTWTTTSPITVTIAGNHADTGGSGIYQQQLLRDQVARTAADCGVGEAWPNTYATVVAQTTAGGPVQTLGPTVTDAAIATGTCYRYRLVAVDNVGNSGGTSATPTAAKTDLAPPTAAFDLAPPSPFSGMVNVTGTASDPTAPAASGVASVTLRYQYLDGPGSGTVATDTSASPTWSIPADTALVADGNYELFIDVTDNAGNTVTGVASRTIVVDNSPPNIALVSFTQGALPDCQHWTGLPSTTFWFSVSGTGCGASTFGVEVTATDPPGGIASVSFPTFGGDPGPSPASDTAAPYATTYSYTGAAANPGAVSIVASGNSGATTPLATRVVRDDSAPTGATITGPGGTSGPAWWSDDPSVAVTFGVGAATDPAIGPDPGSGIRTGAHVLQRRTTVATNCAGGWAPVWTQVGAAGLASPYSDSSVVDGECYQYRIGVVDNTNNVGWTSDTVNEVRIDRTDPTGTIAPLPPFVGGSSFALSGTSADDWSGVAAMSVRIGAGPATACTPAVAPGWTCNWDTTATGNGPVTLTLVLTDAAGNVVDAATASTTVDNALPTGSVTLAEGTNPQWQHVVPGPTPRIWINTDEASGSFTATATGSDASGIFDIELPPLGGTWTGGATVPFPGPYTTTYGWTGPAIEPGTVNATIRDNALNAATAPFEVLEDTAGPTGGSVQYAGGPTSVPSIAFVQGSDADSDVATARIERDEATLTGPGTCDPFPGTWGHVVASSPMTSPVTDGAVSLGTCYRYRLVVVDNVGNVATYTDPESDVVTVEPAGIVITESGGSTAATEGGATDTYQVRLRTIPAGPVTVTIASADGQASTAPTTLTFNPGNWNVDQTVTVTAVDDDVDEVPDPHAGTLAHLATSGADSDYDNLAGADVVATITDDDDAGILLSPSAATVDVAEALTTSDTYAITLTSEPTADVDVAIGNADGQVTATPPVATLDASNWDTGVVVTVSAVDDDIDEAPTHPGVVTHAISSSDPLYAPLTLPDVTADVTDDDATGVTVAPTSGLALDEASVGTTVQYTVVLDSEPLDDVTIAVTGDGQATPSPTSLLFTPANWDTPQPVTMTVVDDPVDEGAHTSTVSHLASSIGDPAYAVAPVAPVTIGIADNDAAGIEVVPAGPLSATEGGAGDSYDIRLMSQPTGNVTIAFATGTELDSITSLVFTPVNWNSFQTVNVVATDDDVDEAADPHQGTIVHTVTSPGDASYDGWTLADVLVDITDDDTAGITVDLLGGVAVDEAGAPATDTFEVELDSRPLAPITVTITPDAQTATTSTLTFTPANWSTAQAVTVTAVDDDVDEADPHPSTIAITAAGDPKYAAVTEPPVTAQVSDDDTAAVVVSPGVLAVDEAGPTSASYTVVLATQPTANVVVTVAPDAQVATSDTTLTFTPVNWASPQTVTVAAVDDPTVEPALHPGQLTHSIGTTDPAYLLVSAAPKDVDVTDDDAPGISIDEGGGVEATEGGADGTYTIVLTRQPRAGETVTVDLTDDSQADVSPTQVVFTSANWNNPVTVTVAAVDDDVQEADPHPSTITHAVSSTDPLWVGLTSAPPVTADIVDDDVAAFVLTASSPYALTEDDDVTTVQYAIRLATEPASPVTVNLTVPSDLGSSVTSLTFDALNWSTDQTVDVNAIDDAITETPVHARTITHATVTGDPYYGALTPGPVQFDVTDNDTPGITVDRTSLAATEGGATDTFTVVLDSQPTSDVTIALTGTQVGFDVGPLVFTAANWSTPQPVVVEAIDDEIDETPDPHAGLVEFAVTSPDAVYDGWPTITDIPVAITDDDVAGVTIAPGTATPLAVDEATPGSASYTVVLDTEPTDDVTVTLGTADGQTTTDVPTVSFTPADWMIPKVVTVTAVDDDIDEADPHAAQVTHVASSPTDSHYGGSLAIDPQPVQVADDDTAAITVTPTAIALDEAAPGTTATFDVVLATEPLAPVTVSLTTPDGQTTTSVPTLTFTPANWMTAQQVVVTVVDDDVDELTPHVATVVTDASSGGDAAYDAIDPTDVTVTIADDDQAGVSITETGGSTDVDEASLTDVYEVVLDTKPVADVTITVVGDSQVGTNVAVLTFTPANWSTAQLVTVNGTPDALVEGPHTGTITHTAASPDGNYDGVAVSIDPVVANVLDDDVAGATITPTSLAVDEDGTLAPTYDVVLDAEPTADVVITVTPDAQVQTGGTTQLTFTPADWDQVQQVTVTAVDDLVTEPTTHPGVVTHAMSSPDPDFNVPVAPVAVAVTDNDDPGVVIAPTTASVAEGGATQLVDVVLLSNPGTDVTVTFASSTQLAAIPPLTFTSANWDQVQQVLVAATDDLVAEGPHGATITIDTASANPFYDTGALTIDDVAVDIADDDTAGVLLTPPAGLAGAEGDVVTYGISLTSEPTDTVELTLAGDADGSLAATTYTFDATTWATPQDVDVTLVQDLIAEGPHQATITGTVTDAGTDAFYGAVPVAPQVIDIADDDTAGVTFTPALPGPLALAEAGPAVDYQVVLDTEPTGDVTIDLLALAGQAVASPAQLTFTPANWMSAQTVSVTAVDDEIAEATPHLDSMTHVLGGADPVYAALVVDDMDLEIDDDDVPGVRILASGADTAVTEGGATDTVQVVLDSEPTDDVQVALAGAQVDLAPNPITFTPANWDTPVDVTVTAIDDDVFEGPHAGTIDATTSSATDTFYAGVTAAQHPVAITDDDVAGVEVVQPASTLLDEDTPAATESYEVRLTSEPTAPVDVDVLPDAQVGATPVTLTFTAANWDTAQQVAVNAVDDSISEADPHDGVVAHDTDSADPAYATGTLTIDTVTFDVADNDTPGITITPTSGHVVDEDGATSTYTIQLLSQPTADVVLSPVSTQLEWSVPSITIAPADWATPVTVTLRAIDDTVDEAEPHAGSLDLDVASADAGYDDLPAATVDAMIGDNDTSDLVITPVGGLTVDEAGTMPVAQYQLTLTSTPTAPVDVALAPDSQVAVAPTTVQLDALTWSTGVTVDVTAVQDLIDEASPHTGTIAHAMTSTDPNFDGEAGPAQLVDVVDDDTAAVLVTASSPDTTVAEDGSVVDSYEIELATQPTADVTITLAPDGQVTTTQPSLLFTPTNWSDAQVVDVQAIDDDVVEAPTHPGAVAHVAASAGDGVYDGLAAPSEPVNVLDDDVAGVVATPAGGAFELAEGGTTDDLVITLTSEPVAPVTVNVATDAQATGSAPSVLLDQTNWDTGVSVTFTAVDDGYIEPSPHTSTVTLSIDPSSDPAYLGVLDQSIDADVTDNDSASVLVDDLDGSIEVDEADTAATDTFTVRLGAAPASGESVDVTIANGAGQVLVTPSPLTFTDGNWDQPQTVAVEAVDDDVDELDPHTSAITFTTSSGDPNFAGLGVADLDASIADDDEAGVQVAPATVSIDEDGATSATFDVALGSEPLGDVEVALSFDPAQVTVTPAGPLTFSAATWDQTQQVTVTAIDDDVDEADPHVTIVSLDASSVGAADPAYDALTAVDATVEIADDDDSALVVTPAGGSEVDEADGSATVTYDVRLATQPTGTVDVTWLPDSQLELVSGGTQTFTAGDWSAPQQVVVRARQDDVDEADPHTGLLAATIAGGDPNYAALAPAPISVVVRDDDVAGIEVLQSTTPEPITEGGAAASYTVALESEPIADVEVSLAPDSQVDTGGVATLIFTPGNWSDPQVVAVTAIDDTTTEPSPHAGAVAHAVTSPDPAYGAVTPPPATFAITDDDVAGFTLTPASPSLTVEEDGATSATYELTVDTTPLADVTVDFAATGGDVTVSPVSHTFPGGTPPAPVTITVTAVDDALVEGPHSDIVTHAMAPGSDPTYLAITAPAIQDVLVDVTDDDAAAVVVDELDGVAVAEASATSDTFEVRLAAQPLADVEVSFAGDTAQLADLAGSTLTFTPATWDDAQVVTVTAVDDPVDEADPHTSPVAISTASPGDAAFDSLPVDDVVVSISDDDEPGLVIVEPSSLAMDEADEAGTERTLQVSLATQPAGTVTVTPTVDAQLGLQSTPISFDATTWSTPQPVVVRPVQDGVAEDDPHPGVLELLVAAPTDPPYASLAVTTRTFQVADDDSASIECAPAADWVVDGGGRLQMAEDPAAAGHDVACEVRLGSVAAQDVTVDVAIAPGGQVTSSSASVVIPAGNAGPATFTFTAVDDEVAEGTHSVQLAFDVSSADPRYAALAIAPVEVDIADDDVAGITATPAGPFAVEEGGTSVPIAIQLDSEPTSSVTVTVLPDSQMSATPATLTFQPGNWDVAQTVDASALDDAIDEPDGHPGVVAFSVDSSDPAYAVASVTQRDFTITDNDAPGVIVTPTDGGNAVTEGGATDRFSVQLGTMPISNVTVTITGDPQVTVGSASLRFTPANWNAAQEVVLTAVQDTRIEGDHSGSVTFALDSLDPAYAAGSGSTPTAQAVAITDDDVAALVVTESEGTTQLAEGGATDGYTVRLAGQPTADVTISVDGGAQVSAAPAALTFTPANWDIAQEVVLTAVQDQLDEPDPHVGQVVHRATTTAPGWSTVDLRGVAANITDDDTAEIVVGQSEDSTQVTEGAAQGDSVTFRLTSQPTTDVSIVPKGDEQLDVEDRAIVLGPNSWRDPITLAVEAVDDEEIEGEHEGTITFEVSSDDPSYARAAVAAIVVAIGDNDDDGEIEDFGDEDEEETSRTPQSGVDPATVRDDLDRNRNDDVPSSGTGAAGADSERREAGTGSAPGEPRDQPEVRTGTRLGGEITASTEPEEEASKNAFERAMGWLQSNWKLWVPLLVLGAVVLGTIGYMTRKDPVKVAQRAARQSGRGGAAGAAGRTRQRPRRGRRRQGDDDDDDEGDRS